MPPNTPTLRVVPPDPPPTAEPSDDALMALAARGAGDAFELLVRRHEANVRRYLTRMTGSAEAADLCQDTFVALWKMLPRYRAENRFTVLLYRVARSKALSHLRWRKVRALFDAREGAAPPAASAPGASALEALLRQEDQRRLSALVAALPSSLRDAVVLHYVEGLDYATISKITGVREATLRSHAHRGLALLQQRLQRSQS